MLELHPGNVMLFCEASALYWGLLAWHSNHVMPDLHNMFVQ